MDLLVYANVSRVEPICAGQTLKAAIIYEICCSSPHDQHSFETAPTWFHVHKPV